MKKLNADIGIIAAGPAGLCASVAAAEMGASVVVFEKAATAGGTANMGMGPFGVESRLQKMKMVDLTKEEVFKQFMDYVHWHCDARMVREYFWRSGATIDWLEDMGVSFAAPMKNFPQSAPTWHVVQPDDGTRPGARAASSMNRVIHERAVELGVTFLFETPAYKLVKENGKICGVLARDKDGEEVELSCKAVIIATGGFGSNNEMIKKYTGYTWGVNTFNHQVPGVVGDGINMAWEAGAGKGRMSIEFAGGNTPIPGVTQGAYPALRLFREANLVINKCGYRVCDESIMQNSSVCANIIDYQPEQMIWKLLDDGLVRYYRKNGIDFPSEVFHDDPTENFDEQLTQLEKEYPSLVCTGDTPEELAEKMGVPADVFASTLEEYNECCEKNFDDYFCKPRKFLRPYRGRRLYAVVGKNGGYGTLGGIKTNWKQEVITEEYKPVEGLWAAGSDTCEIYDGTYMFYLPGNTMGFAVTTGRIAGERAADYVLGI